MDYDEQTKKELQFLNERMQEEIEKVKIRYEARQRVILRERGYLQ